MYFVSTLLAGLVQISAKLLKKLQYSYFLSQIAGKIAGRTLQNERAVAMVLQY